ncbi:50S ribosomal protein L25 [Brevibacillus dissolubilis]|uniref:50S ribosomal protein L25 n=1 Tax=Brevibacillus dissolubilis TaxID=1844116 RepID=UPI0011165822|nr:50S ribosomal protein L25 [Brevibacillus dissolubilis]
MEAIQAKPRQAVNAQSGNSNKALRREGWVLANVYGTQVNNVELVVDGKELDRALRKQATNKPFKLSIDGDQSYDVMVYELQRHPVQANVLHVDFKQINMNEKVHTTVPVVVTGKPDFGTPSLVRHSVEVTCLPGDIPESFQVNVDGLNVGDTILVKDLEVPAGIELGIDDLEVIVSILAVKVKSDESVEAMAEANAVAENADAPVEEAKKV